MNKSRQKNRYFLSMIMTVLSSQRLNISSACTSSSLTSLKKESGQTLDRMNGIKIVSENESYLFDFEHQKIKENNDPMFINPSTLKTVSKQSTLDNVSSDGINDTSTTWFKIISEYFVLSENITRYLGIEHGLDGVSIVNQTLYHNLTRNDPIFIFSNPSHNQNITIKFDTHYPLKLNNTIISEYLNQNLTVPNIDFMYPPWNQLNKTEKNKFLQLAQGSSRRYGDGPSTGLTFYFFILLCLGVPGNLLTCCIILSYSYMRTAPNLFLLNIAIADIFTLLLGKFFNSQYLEMIKSFYFYRYNTIRLHATKHFVDYFSYTIGINYDLEIISMALWRLWLRSCNCYLRVGIPCLNCNHDIVFYRKVRKEKIL